jgi:hypothetical protein
LGCKYSLFEGKQQFHFPFQLMLSLMIESTWVRKSNNTSEGFGVRDHRQLDGAVGGDGGQWMKKSSTKAQHEKCYAIYTLDLLPFLRRDISEHHEGDVLDY